MSSERKRGSCILRVARGCAAEQVQLLLGAARCLDRRFDLRGEFGVVRAPVEQADGEREGVGVAPTQCCDGEPEPALDEVGLGVGCEVLLEQGEHLDRFGRLRERGERGRDLGRLCVEEEEGCGGAPGGAMVSRPAGSVLQPDAC